MDIKEPAVISCDCCKCTFLETMIFYDNNGNTEVCPNCGEKDCFTIIQMGD